MKKEKRTKLCTIALSYKNINPTKEDHIKGMKLFQLIYKTRKEKLLQMINQLSAKHKEYHYPVVVELLRISTYSVDQYADINAILSCTDIKRSERRTRVMRDILNHVLNEIFNDMYIEINNVNAELMIVVSPFSSLSNL